MVWMESTVGVDLAIWTNDPAVGTAILKAIVLHFAMTVWALLTQFHE